MENNRKGIKIDLTKCMHCGVCTGVCMNKSLHMDRTSWEVKYDEGSCVQCGCCVAACPTQIISID